MPKHARTTTNPVLEEASHDGAGEQKKDSQPTKKDGATTFVIEQARLSAFRVDREKGVVHDVAIFGPPRKGNYYVSDQGRHYAEGFHKQIAESCNNSMCFPFHPDVDPTTGASKFRSPRDSYGKFKNLRVVNENGSPMVRGDLHVRPTKKDEVIELIEQGADQFGFSVYLPACHTYFDNTNGVEVFDSISKVKRNPSIDFVEASGSTTNVFESANEDNTPPDLTKETKEETAMTKEEVQAMLEEHGKQLLAQIDPQLKAAAESASQTAKAKRQNIVAEKIAAKKLDANDIPSSLRTVLETCEEGKIESFIDEHKDWLAAHKPVVEGAGGTHENDEQRRTTGVKLDTMESAIESVTERGLISVIESMSTGVGSAASRDIQMSEKFSASALGRIGNSRFRDQQTRQLRKMVMENAIGYSLKDLFEVCTGRRVRSEREVKEAALDTTSFSTINGALLSGVMIEAYDITSEGMISTRLFSPYRSAKPTETYGGMTAPGVMGNVAELGTPNHATMSEKYVTDPATFPAKRAVIVAVSREEIIQDATGQVMRRANSVGEEAAIDLEVTRLKGIFEFGGVQSYRPSGVASDIFVAANTVNNNPLADWTNLEASALELGAQVDENGRFLAANLARPLIIVVPWALNFTASHLVNLTEIEERMNSGAKIQRFRSSLNGTIVLSSKYLDSYSETTWYMGSERGWKKQYIEKQLIPFEVVQIPQAEVQATITDQVAGVKCEYWSFIVALDNKYVEKNTAGAS
jgi:hypothetical protein